MSSIHLSDYYFKYTGPYVGVAGAVFLDLPVCEPLTPVMPLFYLPHNKHMMLQTARMFKALKVAIADLEAFYSQLFDQQHLNSRQQLTYPYINSVKINQTEAMLTYVNKLDSGQYVFQARLEGESVVARDVIVKFAETYSKECHEACYELGMAPELIVCEQITGGWVLVVMELLTEHTTLFSLAQDGSLSRSTADVVEASVKRLHGKGFVHGDLRLPNIMMGPDNSIKLIDFDCAGRSGVAVYLPFRNRQDIKWHPDAKLGGVIRVEHDTYMLNAEFNHLSK